MERNTSVLKRTLSINLRVLFTAALTIVSCADKGATIDPLSDKSAEIIIAEDTRTITEQLRAHLLDSDPALRALACRAIGRIGVDGTSEGEIVELLWPSLSDTAIDVASSAAFALGLLPDNEDLANRLVEYAMTGQAAKPALIAAGRVGDSSSVPLMQKFTIFLNHQRPGFRSRAAMAIFLAGFSQASDVLTQVALGDSVKTVRDTALYALVRLRNKEAVDVYLSYLDDSDDYLKALAVRGLALPGDTNLAERITPFLESANTNLRSQALTTLAALKCEISEKAFEAAAREETDERLSAQALRALAAYSTDSHRKHAIDRIAGDNSLEMDAAIVTYLSATLESKTGRELETLLTNGDHRLLAVFFENLNRSLDKETIKQLIERFLPGSDGPAHYAAYSLCRELDVELDNWMTSSGISEILERVKGGGADALAAAAAFDHAGFRREPWFFDAALNLIRHPEVVPSMNRLDIFGAILDGAARFLPDSANPGRQTKVNAKEVFQTLLSFDDFIISKRAAAALETHFGIESADRIVKPVSLYSSDRLARKIAEGKAAASLVEIALPSGIMTIELDYDAAPLTCLNFVQLIRDGFYDDLVFHRVIPNFVAQGGDPRGDGWGGPGYSIRCEYSSLSYKRGTVGIATSGKDTGGSQFFVALSAQPHLDARYTIIGNIISGIGFADNIRRGDSALFIRVAGANQ